MDQTRLRLLIAITCSAALLAPATALAQTETEATASAAQVRLYPGVGVYHRRIRTDSTEAQQWFDQGLVLLYGFNHDEAIRSFEKAAEADPESPMPWWGIACANGANINDPELTEARWKAGWEAAREAQQRVREGDDSVEAALVHAVAQRFTWPAPAEQRPYDKAYADAMAKAHERYPNDPDVAVFYAESLMDLQPWDYWTNDGEPRGKIETIVKTLESVLAKQPEHPGANHYYIHAIEASQNPEKAEAAADRLRDRVPGAGHLVHMPSHIYVRVGRYADAVDANERAVEADRRYFKLAPEPGFYWLYHGHNLHFLAYAAMMEGRYETAIQAARDLEDVIPEDVLRDTAWITEGVMPTNFHVLIRFGKWEQILEEPEPAEFRLVSRAVRHYARSLACSALGQIEQSRAEIVAFEEAMSAVPQDWWIFNNRVHQVLPIARAMLQGELLFREGKREEAFKALRHGVELEDALVYDEPPGWMQPVRHALGALLMGDKRYKEAEAVYREDLRRNRDNGWSLLGLRESLKAQGRTEEAMAIEPILAAVWKRADVKPTSSCYCQPARPSRP
jgi:tetratricopeptide (TPR) repeat protein